MRREKESFHQIIKLDPEKFFERVKALNSGFSDRAIRACISYIYKDEKGRLIKLENKGL